MSEEQQMKFKIVNIQVKEKAAYWIMKIKSLGGFSEAKSSYKVSIRVDDEFFDNKIAIIQHKIDERVKNPDMFGGGTTMIAQFEEEIAGINNDRREAEGKEIEAFDCIIMVSDFDKGTLQLAISEAKIEEIIKIRQTAHMYVVNLK